MLLIFVYFLLFLYRSLGIFQKLVFPSFSGYFFAFAPSLGFTFFRSILDIVAVKIAVGLFCWFTFWLFLGPALGTGRQSSGGEKCVTSFEIDDDGPGESSDISGGLLSLMEAAEATRGADLSVT